MRRGLLASLRDVRADCGGRRSCQWWGAAVVWGDAVLVNTTGGDVYTSRDAAQLLADLGLHQQSIVLPVVSELIQPLLPLKVHIRPLWDEWGLDASHKSYHT